MKIAVVSMRIGDEYRRITYHTHNNKEEYCQKHGYDLIEADQSLNPNKPVHWTKILLLMKHLADYDCLVWLDADLYVMNYDIKIEDYIEEKMNGKDFAVASDFNMTSTGVLIVKNTEWCKEFLQKWYDHENYPHVGNYEQDAFQDLHNNDVLDAKSHIQVLAPKDSNCYFWNYRKGDFIFHFAGTRNWELESMIIQFCPMRLPFDNEETYHYRMNHLSTMNQPS